MTGRVQFLPLGGVYSDLAGSEKRPFSFQPSEEASIRLKAAELLAKYGTQVNIAEINSIMERDRESIRQNAKQQAQGLFSNNVQQNL